VINRKYEVLDRLVQASRKFDEMCQIKTEVVEAIIAGQSAEEAAGPALGLALKLEDSIHEEPYGLPLEGDKSFFDLYCQTFKLPLHHLAIYKARSLIKQHEEEWAEVLERRARQEVEAEREGGDESAHSTAGEAVKRLAILSEGLGLPQDHPKLVATEMLGKAAKARKVKTNAEMEMREWGQSTNPRGVNEAANRLIQVVKEAAKWGIEKSHPDQRTAIRLSHDLRGYAVQLMAEDEVRLKKTRTNLGDAEKAAERIEAALKESIANGCPVDHEKLEFTRKIALQFREDEGLRKRQANRDKQMAEKAAREGA